MDNKKYIFNVILFLFLNLRVLLSFFRTLLVVFGPFATGPRLQKLKTRNNFHLTFCIRARTGNYFYTNSYHTLQKNFFVAHFSWNHLSINISRKLFFKKWCEKYKKNSRWDCICSNWVNKSLIFKCFIWMKNKFKLYLTYKFLSRAFKCLERVKMNFFL